MFDIKIQFFFCFQAQNRTVIFIEGGYPWKNANDKCLGMNLFPGSPDLAKQFVSNMTKGQAWTGMLRSKAIYQIEVEKGNI